MKARIVVVMAAAAALLLGVVGVLAQEATPSMSDMYTVNMGSNADLGNFLVDANGMTLYTFKNDTPGVSNCTGQCLDNWPALTVADGETPSIADGVPGRLGVMTRDDGTRQVTFNDMPLYTFAQDMAPGDANGQGRGDVWYVATEPTVSLAGNADLGDFLVDANGMTLYEYTKDDQSTGTSTCYDQCAQNWPPLTVDSADALTTQSGVVGSFGTTTRDDGTIQVTYNGWPLYLWIHDSVPGDATGQGNRDVWYVLKPPTIAMGGNSDLGDFLTGPNGMTLYTFKNDTAGVSNCSGQCIANWPALTVADGETPVAGDGVTGTLDTITRDDGTIQVTYNGAPLYYFGADVVPGDANGQGLHDVWYVATAGGM